MLLAGAVVGLMEASDPRGGPDSSSRVALYSLGTVAAYAECKEVRCRSVFCTVVCVHQSMPANAYKIDMPTSTYLMGI
jgi:hypothetical protein